MILKNVLVLNSKQLFERQSIKIIENKIAEISDTNMFEFENDEVYDFNGGVVAIPGLINMHTHSAMTLMRNASKDCRLNDWLNQEIFPVERKLKEEDVYWGSMAAIAEMIRSGTTMFLDMYFYPEAVMQAVIDSGIRANISIGPINSPNKKFDIQYYKQFQKNVELIETITISLELHSLYLHSMETIKEISNFANTNSIPIQIHVAETQWEITEIKNRYGLGVLSLLEQTGLLESKLFAAHCVHLTNSDYLYLSRYYLDHFHIVSCLSSNMKLASGIIKLPKAAQHHLNICLGTDSAASNNNLSLLHEMRTCAILFKGIYQNPLQFSPVEVIDMCTKNPAKALNMPIGSLTNGNLADIVLIDIGQINMLPNSNLLNAIVYSCTQDNVKSVIVGGKFVLKNRQLCTIDEEKVKYYLNKIYCRLYL